jgi:hypothetical protein
MTYMSLEPETAQEILVRFPYNYFFADGDSLASKTCPRFGHCIRVKSIRRNLSAGIEKPHDGQTVVSDYRTFFRSTPAEAAPCAIVVLTAASWGKHEGPIRQPPSRDQRIEPWVSPHAGLREITPAPLKSKS